MGTKAKLIIGAAALLLAFAAGRWAAPEKVRIETKVVEVENVHNETKTDIDKNRHTETTVTEIVRPDGTKEKTTRTTQDTQTTQKRDTASTKDTVTTAEETKEVTRGTAKVTISALAGAQIGSSTPLVYGASVSKPILGPITVGIFGLSNATFGASLGLTF